MAKSVVRVNNASPVEIHTLGGTSLVNTKMEKFDALLVLIGRIYFPERDAKEHGLTKLHYSRKCRARNFENDNFGFKKCK